MTPKDLFHEPIAVTSIVTSATIWKPRLEASTVKKNTLG
jgi:hypothetical protein